MTNNPNKLSQLTRYGVVVSERVPHVVAPNPYNAFYLRTKAEKAGHLIDVNGKTRLDEQHDRPIVEGMTPEQVEAVQPA
jgi:GTP cyclohydrolase II